MLLNHGVVEEAIIGSQNEIGGHLDTTWLRMLVMLHSRKNLLTQGSQKKNKHSVTRRMAACDLD